MDLIEISDNGETYHFPATDKISLETIEKYFPNAMGLTYMSDNIKCHVLVKNSMLTLIPSIKKYSVFWGKVKANPKEVRIDKEVCEDGNPKKRKYDNVVMDIIQRHQSKALNAETQKDIKSICMSKEVFVGWKHFENGKYYLKNNGGSKKILLDSSVKYTYDDIADLSAAKMKDGYNDSYFDRSRSQLELGNFNNLIFKTFADDNDDECDFWKFAPKIKMKNNQYRIYLFTKSKEHSTTQSSTHSGMVPKVLKIIDPNIRKDNINVKKIDASSVIIDENSEVKNVESNNSKDENLNTDKSSSSSDLNSGYVELVDSNEITFVSSSLIGEGGYGTVRKATWRHTEVAVKTVRVTFSAKYAYREILVMTKIRHPNIIMIMGYSINFSQCHIIMEHFKNSINLREFIFDKKVADRFNVSETDKFEISKQICTAIAFLHTANPHIIHKDIKPENILVNRELVVKVCDLGISKLKEMPKALMTTVGSRTRGTPMYMSPELLLDNKSGTIESDIWALACVLKELFTKELVWPKSSESEIIKYLKNNNIPDLSKIPLCLKDPLRRCFNYKLEDRSTSVQLLTAVKCYFYTD